MCGRFSLTASSEKLASKFTLKTTPPFETRYNIAPSLWLPIIALNSSKEIEATPMYWGLIPPWAKEFKIAFNTINARSETLESKAVFNNAYKSRRCLVPADGFYEWDKGSSPKQPWRFILSSGDLFAFAGLWEEWRSQDGLQVFQSFTIVTTEANELVGQVHDRMPVILHEEDYEKWLDTAEYPPAKASMLLKPYPAEFMTTYPVSRNINNPKFDGPTCIEISSN